MKTIIIRLGRGTIEDGFNNINVELKSGTTQWEDSSNLPPNPQLQQLLNEWQLLYPVAIQLLSSNINLSPKLPTFDEDAVTNVSSQDMVELNYSFRVAINNWFNFGDFGRIERRLRTDLNIRDRILLIIISEELNIWQLPWHFWDFCNDYPDAVEVFAKPRFTNVRHIKPQPDGAVNILALSGRDARSNLDLSFLKTLPQSNPTFEREATSASRVVEKLQEVKPSIFIFYGHGDTIEYRSFQDGVIYLDNDTPLEISRLRLELQAAIDRGLQIAIFNCCNGLGLAEQVTDLNIPYIIVMREIIPNQIAQEFLENLLTEYSQGKSFPAAFQQARQNMRLASGEFAQFADWLPILFHNPLSQSVTWEDLSTTAFRRWIPSQVTAACNYLSQPKYQIWTTVGISLIVSLLVLNLQSMPLISGLESELVDRVQTMQIDRLSPRSSKVIVINYDALIIAEDNLSDDWELQKTIDLINTKAKPLDWATNLTIKDRSILGIHPINDCTKSPDNSDRQNYLQLNSCDRKFINSLIEKSDLPPPDSELRLNLKLLNKIEHIDLSKISTLSESQLKQLFDRRFILLGYFDGTELNSVTRAAIVLDRVLRANAVENRIPLFVYHPIGQQFIWIFLWSILTGLIMWRRKWKILLSIAIVSQILVAGMLLFLDQGLPIVITSISIGSIGTILQIVRLVGDWNWRLKPS
jgi:hypothetical protein